MSENNEERSSWLWCLKTISLSLKIFWRNKQVFIPIFTLLTLPVSLLMFSLSLSSLPIKSRIYHLESIGLLSSTRFEAGHVLRESRDESLSLLRLKSLYFLPNYLLSLLSAISVVNSTSSSFHSKRPTLRTAFAAVRLTWKRFVATSIFVYVSLLLYAEVPRVMTALVYSPGLKLLVWVIGSSIEVYLMAVLGLGLVVSVVEERFGWEAIRVGSSLMEGRRVAWWVLSGLGVLVTGWIGWRVERAMDGLDSRVWTVVMSGWDKVGLVCGYGLLVILSYVVTTVFYCECRKRHVIKDESEGESLVTV
ncbi:hypothetical protein CFOL_v3_33949 [Cephalotus follicularis]|uniref:Uncharacterized protein n=1 Tax=Cephalotus follicularis TaxID=3775 RepID=A0A1Q3DDJ5_CEPFO|nr:hypothetical protein CFOL_v3_33949 [Cephalotus follicularis]